VPGQINGFYSFDIGSDLGGISNLGARTASERFLKALWVPFLLGGRSRQQIYFCGRESSSSSSPQRNSHHLIDIASGNQSDCRGISYYLK